MAENEPRSREEEPLPGPAFRSSWARALAPWWQALQDVWWIFLLARLFYLLWGAAIALSVGVLDDYGQVIRASWPPAAPLGDWLYWLLLRPGLHYDAAIYLDLATKGYAQNPAGAGFYPLHPLAIRAVWLIVGEPLLAATLLNVVVQLALVVCLYRFVSEEFSPSVGRWTVIGLLSFPLSFLLAVPYSETTFLLPAVVAFWAARRRNWAVAGVAGALAAGVRQPGLFLLPALGLEWLLWAAGERRRRAWLSGLWLALLPLLPLAFTYYLYAIGIVHTSPWNPLGVWQAVRDIQQQYWASRFVMPWETVSMLVTSIVQDRGGLWAIDLFWGVLLTVLVALSLWEWRRPGLITYGLVSLLAAWTKVVDPSLSTSPIQSLPRRLLVVFPLFLVLGRYLERYRLARIAWWTLAPAFFLVQSALFIHNSWIP